jgi:hypothetical protein
LLTRGASTPAQTTVAGWAADLAFTTVADLVIGDVALGPVCTVIDNVADVYGGSEVALTMIPYQIRSPAAA